jgi:hypothetical protein
MYKFYIITLTSLLTNYGEQHKILHYSQEGFHPQHNIAQQLQMLIHALEDANYTSQDIYTTYIYFCNAFGFIDTHNFLPLRKTQASQKVE